MRVLEINNIDKARVRSKYERVVDWLREGNFTAAEVKKLTGKPYYRAKLDHTNRLLFKFGSHGGERLILLLEVIYNHDYNGSRFLRGAGFSDGDFVPVVLHSGESDLSVVNQADETLRYVNPHAGCFHVLDRVLSLDETQTDVFAQPLPHIVIGSAGSGKTVLVLEKMKTFPGRVLYVTHSSYLVENSRALYRANGFGSDDQEVDFLSFGEYLATLAIPAGKEVGFPVFAHWFQRVRRGGGRIRDAHRLFEEFKGVITGSVVDREFLSREDYLSLGIKQSILPEDERGEAYDLFERYLAFLRTGDYYDSNVIAYHYHNLVKPAYDMVVVDEVQDFTNVQLSLVLKGLQDERSFILSGDSNQIVHPNFFSWSRVKSFFYLQHAESPVEIIRILHTNYRNSTMVTELANRLLRIKHARFGSLDKESNYLVRCNGDTDGVVELREDSPSVREELNKKTQRSTRYAVIVLSDEDKVACRQCFETPLVFSIREAKGLEYDNVILFNLVSSAEKEFRAICEGVDAADLLGDELSYSRRRDKSDRSGEVYKFFINSLYVALTRAVRSLYVIERRPDHVLFELLDIKSAADNLTLESQESSLEDWQREARKLELQGKSEQAESIRRDILKQEPVPWKIMNDDDFLALVPKACDPHSHSKQIQRQVYEYSLAYDIEAIYPHLANANYKFAQKPADGHAYLRDKHYTAYRNIEQLRTLVRRHGPDFLGPLGEPPAVCAVKVVNKKAIDFLVDQGADLDAVGNDGLNAFQVCLRRIIFTRELSERAPLVSVLTEICPPVLRLKVRDRMVKLESRHMEFFLFHFFVATMRLSGMTFASDGSMTYSAVDLAEELSHLPDVVLPEYRKRRTYISGILSKSEIGSASPYNHRIFYRVRRGQYMLTPDLEVEVGGAWHNIYALTRPQIVIEALQPDSISWFAKWMSMVRNGAAAVII